MANIYLKQIDKLLSELDGTRTELDGTRTKLDRTENELKVFKQAHLIAMQINRMTWGATVPEFISILLTHLGVDADYYDTILEMLVELKHANRSEKWINDDLHTVDHTPYRTRKNAINEVAYEILHLFNTWRTKT